MSKTVIAKGPLGDEHEVALEKLQWRPSVYGIVIHEGKILLSPQFKKGHDIPGGGVDLGEKLEDAVVREVKEETGIDVKVRELLTVHSNFFAATHNKDRDDIYYQSIMLYYKCEMVGGEISNEGFDEYEQEYAGTAEWVSVEKIDEINPISTFDFRPVIKQALKGSK